MGSTKVNHNSREKPLVQDSVRFITFIHLQAGKATMLCLTDSEIHPIRSYFPETRMPSYEQVKPQELAHPMAKDIYSECLSTSSSRRALSITAHQYIWLFPKTSNETVRDRLSFGMYLQFLCFLPFPKDLRIQLPLKT